MRKFAQLSEKSYNDVIRLTNEVKRKEMARPPQGRHHVTELEAEYRAFGDPRVKYAIADQQFMERLTNQWAAVAQVEILAHLAETQSTTSADWRRLMGNLPATFIPDTTEAPGE